MQKNISGLLLKGFLKLIAFEVLLFSCSNNCGAGAVYVSSLTGKDSNLGIVDTSPLKTIDAALAKSDTIRLKCGEHFFVKGINLKGKYLANYGEGALPVVSGYKRIVEPSWERVEGNIWKLNLASDNFTGRLQQGSSMSNNIGCIHEYDKDLIHGHKVQFYSELETDWDIWQTERFDGKTPTSEFDWVYLYYHGNPNKLKLEFSITDTAVRMSNATIENIRFEGYGFGISAGTNSIIRGCEIDAVGGRIQIGYGKFTCYGNGIEFYVYEDIGNCLVEDCVISRCYDCGITIQASNYKQATPRNIIIRNNLIDRCCQGWEDFLRNDSNVMYENCVFEKNIVTNSGNSSGFGYPESRFKYCHVLGNNTKGNKGMIIRNNTFVGGNYYCSGAYQGEYKSNVWEGNTCVIKRGDYILGNYTGTKDVIRIPKEKGEYASLKEATDNAIKRYRRLTGDETTKFIIKDEKTINRQVAKLKKKYLKRE